MADMGLTIEIDQRVLKFANPAVLKQARKKAVEAAGMVWADEAKSLTRREDHIDTGLYINSIGYATGDPNHPLYVLSEGSDQTELAIGANVAYAGALEKRYAIFARSLDTAKSRMERVAETQVKNTLGL